MPFAKCNIIGKWIWHFISQRFERFPRGPFQSSSLWKCRSWKKNAKHEIIGFTLFLWKIIQYVFVYRSYSCFQSSAILKGKVKSFQHFLWTAVTTCLISLMCGGWWLNVWGKYPNESEWKLGRVQIILKHLLFVPLENTYNQQGETIDCMHGANQ